MTNVSSRQRTAACIVEAAVTAEKVLESIFFTFVVFYVLCDFLCVFVLIETAVTAEKVLESIFLYLLFFMFCVFLC